MKAALYLIYAFIIIVYDYLWPVLNQRTKSFSFAISSLVFFSMINIFSQLTDSVHFGSFLKELGVVDSLSSRQDFFTTHEHVVRVGPFLGNE